MLHLSPRLGLEGLRASLGAHALLLPTRLTPQLEGGAVPPSLCVRGRGHGDAKRNCLWTHNRHLYQTSCAWLIAVVPPGMAVVSSVAVIPVLQGAG